MSSIRWRFKKVVVWLALWSLVAGLLPGMALAAEKQAVNLEQAIQAVKTAFEVPEEFTTFSSGYNQLGERQTWSLNWRTAKEPGGSLSADVDAQTGDVLNVNIWQYQTEPESRAKLPAISRDEAVEIAQNLLDRLHPGRLAELKLQPGSHELLPLMAWGPATYNIQWQRLVDGVPFPQDGVSIAVSTETGQVNNYNFHWTRGELPDAGKIISPEQARAVFDQAEMLNLQYFRPHSRDRGQSLPVILVYRLEHPSQGAIDALTGEPVDFNSDEQMLEGMGGMGGMSARNMKAEAAQAMAVQAPPLTPEEIKEIDIAANFISQEDAEAVVRQWVTIPDDMQLHGVHLYSNDWDTPGLRTWNFQWNIEQQEIGQGYTYLSAQVNAVSGELLGFSRNQPWLAHSSTDQQGMTREEANKIAEEFLQQIQPDRFKQVKLMTEGNPSSGPITFKEDMSSQAFNYLRLVNGITFPANGMSANVDASTGDILSYYLNWSEIDFLSPDGVLQQAAAGGRFLAGQPLTLHYTTIFRSDGQQEIKLIYRPLAQPGTMASDLIDASTGEALDWQGKPLAQQPQPYRFTDIADHWAEKEISLLGQAGILGGNGDTFQPGEEVTVAQFLRAMLMLNDSVAGVASLTDDEVLQRAKQYGWVKEDLHSGNSFSRQMLARLTVRFLGLDRAAQVQGIYTAPFTDLQEIDANELGYVALSWGLGVLRGDAGKFRPGETVTRAEAAVALIRALPIER